MEGDLRPGGAFRSYLAADDVASTGRVEVCVPQQRLRVTTRETDESYQKGQGTPPFDMVTDITLVADGEQTLLVVEVLGLPLAPIAFYGVGVQIHVEHLAAYLAGRDPDDPEARWSALLPPYQDLAAHLG